MILFGYEKICTIIIPPPPRVSFTLFTRVGYDVTSCLWYHVFCRRYDVTSCLVLCSFLSVWSVLWTIPGVDLVYPLERDSPRGRPLLLTSSGSHQSGQHASDLNVLLFLNWFHICLNLSGRSK